MTPVGRGSTRGVTVPALIRAVPMFVLAASVRIGAAAAILAVSPMRSVISLAALRVGWMRKLSPAAIAGLVTVRPSSASGVTAGLLLAAVVPSDSRLSVYVVPSYVRL